MTDLFDAIRILLLISFAVFGNIVYLLIYNVLTEKGIKATWFRGHVTTLLDFSDLAARTEDKKDRRHYKNLLRTFLVILVLFIGTASTFIIDLKNMPCKTYTDFLEMEISGQVVDRFQDKPNHNSQTLTIETTEERTNDIYLSLRNHGLYDSVRIGDIISKIKGDSVTVIVRDDKRIEFKIDKGNYWTLPKKVCKRLSNCVKGLYFAPLSEDVDKLIHHQTPVAYGQRPSSGYFS